MIDQFALQMESSGEPTNHDLKVLTVLLLLGAAQADARVEGEELTQVVAAAGRSFGSSDHEVGELLEIAEFLLRSPSDAERLLDRVNERFSDEQREHLAAMVWRVVLVDGSMSNAEKRFLGLAKIKLKLPEEAITRARENAEAQLAAFVARAGKSRE